LPSAKNGMVRMLLADAVSAVAASKSGMTDAEALLRRMGGSHTTRSASCSELSAEMLFVKADVSASAPA
jgi:hypothetical protein